MMEGMLLYNKEKKFKSFSGYSDTFLTMYLHFLAIQMRGVLQKGLLSKSSYNFAL